VRHFVGIRSNVEFRGAIEMKSSIKALVFALVSVFTLSACVASPPYDYSALIAAKPRSILVVPPANNSIEVNAPYIYLSTISRPLGEKGYYVFPVSLIDHFLKENGLPTPAEMNSIPLDKIRENIGADAVLYVTIDNWGQKYQLISSKTVVSATLKLIDTRSGQKLWGAKVYGEKSSDGGNNGLIGALISAAVDQIAGSLVDYTPQVARTANYNSINDRTRGLLIGPYRTVKNNSN
jgi:hypothetical protein